MAEKIIPRGDGTKYHNPRRKYDGINMWLTVSVEVNENQVDETKTEPIGIDLGLKTLAVCSNGKEYKKPNIRKPLKRLKRLQCSASRIYLYMKRNQISFKEKSKRLIKLEKLILKENHKITNILNDNIHKKEKLSLSERVFVCNKCGIHIDRELNAALNLKKLAI